MLAILCVILGVLLGAVENATSFLDKRENHVGPGPNKPVLLNIKSFPAIENYQSDLYQVFAEPPYPYHIMPAAAIALLQGEGESAVKGEIMFEQTQPAFGPTLIRGNITGLPPGKHGVHIFQSGDLRQGCEKLGQHFNPFLLQHGGPSDHNRHVGDLGNIEAGEDGTAEIEFIDPLLSLSGSLRGIVGRALVISTNPDDLGRGGTANSFVDGDSGKPLACGVIAFIR